VIGIIDYGAGNIASVKNALEFIGEKTKIITTKDEIRSADSIVFPGVGSFGAMVDNIKERHMFEPLYDEINSGKPYLGICLGLQLLFDGSDENPNHSGFCIFPGTAKKFTQGKIPQIGWNLIEPASPEIEGGWAYYVNSYRIKESSATFATSDYYGSFVAAVRKDNIVAFQFHPEKSGPYGLSLLKWWTKCLQKE